MSCKPLFPAVAALAALSLWSAPALAQSCDDPDPSLDLNTRVAVCEEVLASVYDRSILAHMVYNLGRSYRLLGNLDAALPLLHEAISYTPTNEYYWAELGQVYLALNEPSAGAAMYGEARRLAPSNPYLTGDQAEAWLNLGRADLCLENLDAALPALVGDPDEAWFVNLRGRCEASLGRQDAALATYAAALTLYPGYVDAIGNRVFALHALGRYQDVLAESAVVFDGSLGTDPGRDWEISLRALRIEALYFLGRIEEAGAEVAALKAHYPGSDLGVANLTAWTLFLAGKVEDADRAIQPIRDLGYSEEVAGYMMDTLAQIDLKLGRMDLAQENFLNAAWVDPALAKAWLPPLVKQGYLPMVRSADDILVSLLACIEDKGAECSLTPLPFEEVDVPLPARPGGPAAAADPAPTDPPDAPDAEGEPTFEPAPADTPDPPAADLPAPPGLGASPRPVRPVAP